MVDRIGQQLGHYRLIKLLGKGGFAEVYLGQHIHLDTLAAIKVLHTQLATHDEMEEFRREARTIARLEHPHIVHILDFGLEDDAPFFVMNYAPYGSLRNHHPKDTILPLANIVSYIKQVADALQYAHQEKLIHRDIKPENMLLGRRNEILLSDFGIAVVSHSTHSMSLQREAGTVPYMAPEQIQGKARPASDQYALGVVVYEWLSGTQPFHGSYWEIATQHVVIPPPPLGEKVPSISPGVEQIVMKALAKEPQQRFPNVQAFAIALEQAWREAERFSLYFPIVTTPLDMNTPTNQSSQSTNVVPSPNQLSQSMITNTSSSQSSQSDIGNPSLNRLPEPLNFVTLPNQSPQFSSETTPPSWPPATLPLPGKPQLPKRSGSKRIFIGFTVLTILGLVLISLLMLLYNNNIQSLCFACQTTATSTAKFTVTAFPTLTPKPTTTIIPMTATVQAQASATAGVIQTATAGQPVYQDSLSDPNNSATQAAQWDENNHCGFQSDGYHVTQGNNITNFRGCHETGNTYKNATISVDMNMLSGHSGGLFFRLGTDALANYSGYLFEVDSQGNYRISTVSGGTPTPLPGHDWTKTSALKQGVNVKNTLQVIMSNNSFLFYANGIFLTQVTDTTFNAAGAIGFLATTQGTNANIAYSNLKVYLFS